MGEFDDFFKEAEEFGKKKECKAKRVLTEDQRDAIIKLRKKDIPWRQITKLVNKHFYENISREALTTWYESIGNSES